MPGFLALASLAEAVPDRPELALEVTHQQGRWSARAVPQRETQPAATV